MEIRTITRRMRDTRNDMFRGILTRDDFVYKLDQLKHAELSQRPTICASLRDMFTALQIDCEEGKEDSYYEQLIASSEVPAYEDIESRIIGTMFSYFDQYPTPEVYMLRIVNRMADPEDGWEEDTLRLRILKQFIKYGGCGVYLREARNDQGEPVLDKNGKVKQEKVKFYGGETYLRAYTKEKTGHSVRTAEDILEAVEDSVFDILHSAKREQTKADGKYGILKVADDLAKGRFKSGGATKKDLYLFAMVYNMTYYCDDPESDSILDYDSDIEKNLFEDYYSNNLMRFITEAYAGNLSAYEMDPSGQGINYKNFSEMVYIYFLSKDYSALEKIRRATEMIERLETASDASETPSDGETSTQYYAHLFTEEILAMPEDVFEAFVLQHYDCKTAYTYKNKNQELKTTRKSAMQMQTTQHTAEQIYQEIIEGISNAGTKLCNCNYGLYFTDVSAYRKASANTLEAMQSQLEAQKPDQYTEAEWKDRISRQFPAFVTLLTGIHRFMGIEFNEAEANPDAQEKDTDPLKDEPSSRHLPALYKTDSSELTRTSLVIAYYYFYNAKNTRKAIKKTFIEVYEDYINPKVGLNALLEEAGYQPVSDKNIFDIAVIFSSYAYLMN